MSSVSGELPVRAGSQTAWWTAGACLGAGVLLLLAAYASTFASMAGIWWRSDTFAHGMVVYPIAAWLVWRERSRLRAQEPCVAPLALLPLGGLAIAWLIAHTVDVQVVQHAAVVAMIATLVWLCLGARIVRMLWFPLLFTIFAVPFGEGLIPWMMEFTADFTVGALRLFGIPVFREGMLFSTPRGDFEVAKACSGIRYLIASLALGTLYAYLTYRSSWRRLLFVIAAAVVPIVANGLRALGIVMIAHFTDMRHAVGVDHLIYGWLFFGLVIFVLFWVGGLFREDETPAPAAAAAPSRRVRAAPYPGEGGALVLVLAAVLVAAPPAAATFAGQSGVATSAASLPVAADGWRGPAAPLLDWQPHFQGASHVLRARYELVTGGSVEVAAVVYTAQREDAELVSDANELVPGDHWAFVKQRIRSVVPVRGGRGPARVAESELTGKQGAWKFWAWYLVGGEATASDTRAKLLQAGNALPWQTPVPAALVAVAASSDGEGSDAGTLRAFIDAHARALATCVTLDAPRAGCIEQ